MKPLVFSTKSWHWRIVSFLGLPSGIEYAQENDTLNICQYTRTLLFKTLLCTIVACVALLVSCITLMILLNPIVFLIVGVITGNLFNPNYQLSSGDGTLGVSIWIILIIATFLFGTDRYIVKRQIFFHIPRISLPGPPKFVQEAYTSFKEKTCVRIEIKTK